MSPDLQDRFLDWISIQEQAAKLSFEQATTEKEFYEGRYLALIDAKVFILTSGKLTEPLARSTTTRLKKIK